MQSVCSSVLGEAFPSPFLLCWHWRGVRGVILVPSATQTSGSQRVQSVSTSQTRDYFKSFCFRISFAICLSVPFQRKIQGAPKVQSHFESTCIKHEFAQVQFQSWYYWPLNLLLILFASWKEFNQLDAFQFWQLEAIFACTVCGQRSSLSYCQTRSQCWSSRNSPKSWNSFFCRN